MLHRLFARSLLDYQRACTPLAYLLFVCFFLYSPQHNGLRGLTSADFSRRMAISAEPQIFTIVGTDAAVGGIDPYSEGSTVSANGPWGPTYSLGPTHPWQDDCSKLDQCVPLLF
jgi:hypothetical protein